MHEKAKFDCLIYTKPHKMKFKFVQINMKQVSYNKYHHILVLLALQMIDQAFCAHMHKIYKCLNFHSYLTSVDERLKNGLANGLMTVQ